VREGSMVEEREGRCEREREREREREERGEGGQEEGEGGKGLDFLSRNFFNKTLLGLVQSEPVVANRVEFVFVLWCDLL